MHRIIAVTVRIVGVGTTTRWFCLYIPSCSVYVTMDKVRHFKVAVGFLCVFTVVIMLASKQLTSTHVPQTSEWVPRMQVSTQDLPLAKDYMTEEEAMELPPCKDPKLAPDLDNSALAISDSKKDMYRLGDTLLVTIYLYNGYGKPMNKGGAVLRARMFNLDKKAFATTPVTDHGNGTYTAMFEALWTGNATIKVSIAYTPETIRAIYYFRQKLGGTRKIVGTFERNRTRETTDCHVLIDFMEERATGKICNFTEENYGMPWYCFKPKDEHLTCKDWKSSDVRILTLPMTSCERILRDRARSDIKSAIGINVVRNLESSSNIVPLPSNPCKTFDVTKLWTLNQPTGFVYGHKWHLRHCKGQTDGIWSCLKDKKILLFGDSTVRQWYVHVAKTWNCKQITEKWTNRKWHKRSVCENTKYNFSVEWIPHSQPVSWLFSRAYKATSIARKLDETGSDEHVIAMIHLFGHMLPYHHSAFRLKIQKIRESVESLLKRNRFVKVLFKGPHTCSWRGHSDYYGPIYKHILYEEFRHLHDKVIFLDNIDIANAVKFSNIHPPAFVVEAMINQMLAYLCG